MEVNLEICKAIAITVGLPLKFVIKEFHIFNVLWQVTDFAAKHNKKLIFKGGTALSKAYLGKAQRFSEDIDFDLDENPDAVMQFSKQLAQSIKEYVITDFRKVYKTIQFYCKYDSSLIGERDHVRVDIASKKIITSQPPITKYANSEFTNGGVSVYVYSVEDLLARKMNALCDRTEGKDVYDVYMGLPLCSSMDKAIVQMLKSEDKKETAKEFLQKTIEHVKKADYKKLRNLTNPFIPVAYRPKDWLEVKDDLVMKLENLNV
ncbi:nucleotidyl transferase AbiEii/AbiGii toxin family protein [Candidatus Micrarchaeota archaeon]|nr:nucleotidyl transferase AbiEii/AbiGii toxin family protein [Candidatus Micrarchaeota archaeon]